MNRNAHLDRNKGLPGTGYVNVFIDMLIGAKAQCVAYGVNVGNYALLATRVSGTSCMIRCASEKWLANAIESTFNAPQCKLKSHSTCRITVWLHHYVEVFEDVIYLPCTCRTGISNILIVMFV